MSVTSFTVPLKIYTNVTSVTSVTAFNLRQKMKAVTLVTLVTLENEGSIACNTRNTGE